MLQTLLNKLDGKKTYIFIVLYAAYKVAVQHGWFQASADIETALIAGMGLSANEAIHKP